jgi:hypothetical protein
MELKGKHVAVLAEDLYEDLELWYPVYRFREAGAKVTCFFAIKDDLINAGALYEDREVVRDGNLVTSRKPEDLPAFCRLIGRRFDPLKLTGRSPPLLDDFYPDPFPPSMPTAAPAHPWPSEAAAFRVAGLRQEDHVGRDALPDKIRRLVRT